MVQPKYSPQEALERVKLMMKYNSSKTLNENIKDISVVLNEQSTNSLNYAELGDSSEELRRYLTGDVQTSDLNDIQTLINKVKTKHL